MLLDRKKRTIIQIVLTTALILWFLSKSDINMIFKALTLLPFKCIILIILIDFFCIFINSIKWFLLLKEYTILKLFKMNLISQYYSLLLPGQLAGEVAKGYLLGSGQKNTPNIASSIIVDRLTGFVGLFIVSIFGVVFSDQILPGNFKWLLFAGVFSSLLFLFAFRIDGFYNHIMKILNLISAKYKIFNSISNLFTAWHMYSKDIRTVSLSIFIGTIYQLLGILSIFILAYGLHINISIIDWSWILGILSLALFIPLTIAGIGIRDGTLIGILVWMGNTKEEALALSFSLLGLKIIHAMVGGMLTFIRKK